MVVGAIVGTVGTALALTSAVGKLSDNNRYWSEYRKNTGYSPRYKFRNNYYGLDESAKAFSYGGKFNLGYSTNYIQNNSFYRGNWYGSDFYVSEFKQYYGDE